jgi:hypothetical protein
MLNGAGGWVKGRVLSKVDKQGVGWVVLYYRMFLAKVQETPKPLQSHSKDYSKAIKSYSSNNLLCFLFFVLECLE